MIKQVSKLTKLLFIIYCVLLAWIVLFKLTISISDIYGGRSINLIPFYYENEVSFHFKEIIYNVIIFIPLGIFLKMYEKENKNIILIGLIVSISFEISQFIFKIGASDITDIITNTFGATMGVLIYNLLNKFIKNKLKLNKVINILGLIFLSIFLLLAFLIILYNVLL